MHVCCPDLQLIKELKIQPLFKRMAQHRREIRSEPQSAVHLLLRATNQTFDEKEVKILARVKDWFKSGGEKSRF